MTAKASCCRKSRNIDSALELDGSKVCVQDDTTTELNLADYFRANNMKYAGDEIREAGRCRQGL